MMRFAVWLVAAALSFATAARPQEPAPTGNPRLTASAGGIRDAAHTRALQLKRFDLKLVARGAVATGTVEVSFASDGEERLEGDFRLALPANAVVTGYALDVGGQMVDGVLVDSPRAKAVYEARVRQRVDPGLAEVAADGSFRTRVFPIGRAGRTIRVSFAAPIPASGLRLPIALTRPTDGWSVDVRVTGATAAPALVLPGRGAVTLAARPDGFAARAEGGAEPVTGDLILARPAAAPVLLSRHRTGERFVQLTGALPAAAPTTPRRVRLYWDRSRSRLDDRLEAELGVIRRLLDRWPGAAVELVAFNSSAPRRSVAQGPADAVAQLRAVQYRGATSFAGIDAKVAGGGPADRCILFSDGRPTIDRAAAFDPACPLDAVASGDAADRAWLGHLAAAHGGRVLTLGAADEAAVADALAAAPAGVTAVVDARGRPLDFVALDAAPGRWAVVARAPALDGVTVRTTGGAAEAITLPAEPEAFDGEGALLARDALATLGATERRADYLALSRRYGIASPSLSFLVLETPADYIQADIDPPASYPDASRQAWQQLRKAASGEEARDRSARLEAVVESWTEEVAWWERRFSPGARPKRRREEEDDGASPPPPPPSPPPPPPPPAPEVAPPAIVAPAPPAIVAAPSGDVVVTGTRASGAANLGSATPVTVVTQGSSGRPRGTQPGTAIAIEAWQPDRPYLKMFDAAPERFDALFAEQERAHGTLPAFYLDVAEWLRKRGRVADAAETVLSALELPAANEVTLGIVAGRLERYGQLDRAIELRERHAVLDPDRPQPRRLLALTLAARAKLRPAGARADLQHAVDLLAAVATDPLDARWNGIDLIALVEANALLPRLLRLGGHNPLDRRLVRLLDSDLRVVVDWTTDATDLDLWVDEPTGERVIYSNQRSAIGGHLSDDMTAGYGPEEYFLRRAVPGGYRVSANVFAGDRLDPNGASLITARLIRDFGRPTQREEVVDIELTDERRGERQIGRLVVPGRSAPAR